jgi:hypothetical protein
MAAPGPEAPPTARVPLTHRVPSCAWSGKPATYVARYGRYDRYANNFYVEGGPRRGTGQRRTDLRPGLDVGVGFILREGRITGSRRVYLTEVAIYLS